MLVAQFLHKWQQVLNLSWTTQQDQQCFGTWRWHERLEVRPGDWSIGSDPAGSCLPQHQVEVEPELFRQHAELLDEDEVIWFLADPEQTHSGVIVIVGHDGVDESVGSRDPGLVSHNSDVFVALHLTSFPLLEFSVSVISVLCTRPFQLDLFAFLP